MQKGLTPEQRGQEGARTMNKFGFWFFKSAGWHAYPGQPVTCFIAAVCAATCRQKPRKFILPPTAHTAFTDGKHFKEESKILV
jgi:hypothetical protein